MARIWCRQAIREWDRKHLERVPRPVNRRKADPRYNRPPMKDPRIDPSRRIRALRGQELTCRSWLTEAAYRMIQNNLDPEVAENPTELVVYGGIGRAARNWESYDRILTALKTLGDDE